MIKFINTVMKIKDKLETMREKESHAFIYHGDVFLAIISCYKGFSGCNFCFCLSSADVGTTSILFETEEELLRHLLNSKLSDNTVDHFSISTSYDIFI